MNHSTMTNTPVVETVTLALASIDPQPQSLAGTASLTLDFLKPLPAITAAGFMLAHDSVKSPLVVTFTEQIEESGDVPVAISLAGTPVGGTVTIDSNVLTFLSSGPVELNRSYDISTAGSSLLGTAEQDPVLVQHLQLTSPQLALPGQSRPYLLAGAENSLLVLFGMGVDPGQLANGRVILESTEAPFDWATSTFMLPDLAGEITDGDIEKLELQGTLPGGGPLQVANTISIRLLLPEHDFDGDGLANELEISLGLDPTNDDSDGNGTPDGGEDHDGDGLSNAEELALGTDPADTDSDNDGLSDYQEVRDHHSNPLVTDSDGDGLDDGLEVKTGNNPTANEAMDLGNWTVALEVAPVELEVKYSAATPPTTQLQVVATLSVDDSEYRLNVTGERFGTRYASDNQAVAVHQRNGLFTAAGDGSAVLRATLGSSSGEAALTVLPATDAGPAIRLVPTTSPQKLYAGSDTGELWFEPVGSEPVEIRSIFLDGFEIPVERVSPESYPVPLITTGSAQAEIPDDGSGGYEGDPVDPGGGVYAQIVSGNYQQYGNGPGVVGYFGDGPVLIYIGFPAGVSPDVQGRMSFALDVYRIGDDEDPETMTVNVNVPVEDDPEPAFTFTSPQPGELNLQVGEALDIPLVIDDAGYNTMDVRYLLDGVALARPVTAPYPQLKVDEPVVVTTNIVNLGYERDYGIMPTAMLVGGAGADSYRGEANYRYSYLAEWAMFRVSVKEADCYRLKYDYSSNFTGYIHPVAEDGSILWNRRLACREYWDAGTFEVHLQPGEYVVVLAKGGESGSEGDFLATELRYILDDYKADYDTVDGSVLAVTLEKGAAADEGGSGDYEGECYNPCGDGDAWSPNEELKVRGEQNFITYRARTLTDLGRDYKETRRAYGLAASDIGSHTLSVQVIEHLAGGEVREHLAGSYILNVTAAATQADCGYIDVTQVSPAEGATIFVRDRGDLAAGEFTSFTPLTIKASAASGIERVEWLNRPSLPVPLPGVFPVDVQMLPAGVAVAASERQYGTGSGEHYVDFREPFGLHIDYGGQYTLAIDHQHPGTTAKVMVYDAMQRQEVATVQGAGPLTFDLAAGDYYAFVAIEYPLFTGEVWYEDGYLAPFPDIYMMVLAEGQDVPEDYFNFHITLNAVDIDTDRSFLFSRQLEYRFDSVDNTYFTLGNIASYQAIARSGLQEIQLRVTSNCGAEKTLTLPVAVATDPDPVAVINNMQDGSVLELGATSDLDISIDDSGRDVLGVMAFLRPSSAMDNVSGDIMLSAFFFAGKDAGTGLVRPWSAAGDTCRVHVPVTVPLVSEQNESWFEIPTGSYQLYLVILEIDGKLTSSVPVTVEVIGNSMPPAVEVYDINYSVPAGESFEVEFSAAALGPLSTVHVRATGAVEGGDVSLVFAAEENERDMWSDVEISAASDAQPGETIVVTVTAEDANGRTTSKEIIVEIGSWGGIVEVAGLQYAGDSMRFADIVVKQSGSLIHSRRDIKFNSLTIEDGGKVIIEEIANLTLHERLQIDTGGELQVYYGSSNLNHGMHGGDNGTYRAFGDFRRPITACGGIWFCPAPVL